MKYLHTMIRVLDLEKALDFFVNKLGLQETGRIESEKGRFTLVFLASAPDQPEVELTYNWDQKEAYATGRFFGHLAYSVENIYDYCDQLQKKGVTILRPPRDGKMAFIRSPDQISIEILQEGSALDPQEPWLSMQNQGEW
jgi:lactoylglutathione lyase